jgi:hypothetical protein
MEASLFQLKVIRNIVSCAYFGGSAKPGDMVWVKEENGVEHLISNKLCAWPETDNPPFTIGKPLRNSEGFPIDRFAFVMPEWKGRTVVCIGGGPSVTESALALIEAARLRDAVRVIAVNDMYLVAPWADVLYFADARWWDWHNGGIEKAWAWKKFSVEQQKAAFDSFAGQKVSIFGSGMQVKDPNVYMLLQAEGRSGLSTHPRELVTGGNSGYQAVNIATLAGSKRVLLVGYDMRFDGYKSHSHNGHPIKSASRTYSTEYVSKFATMNGSLPKLGVEVLNCTPGSALGKLFPIMSLECALTF